MNNKSGITKPSIRDLVSYVILTVFSAVCVFWLIPHKTRLPPFYNDKSIGHSPRIFPYIICILLGLICLGMIAVILIRASKYKKVDPDYSLFREFFTSAKEYFAVEGKTYLTIGILVLYAIGIKSVGFIVTSYVISIIVNYLLGARKPVQMFVVPAILIAVVYLTFSNLLDVRFPTGILF